MYHHILKIRMLFVCFSYLLNKFLAIECLILTFQGLKSHVHPVAFLSTLGHTNLHLDTTIFSPATTKVSDNSLQ